MNTSVILLTGASGSVGQELVRRFAATGAEIHVLRHRAPVSAAPDKTVVHQGDLVQAGLGLNSRSTAILRRRITAILHCGGLTEFSIARSDAERVNVRGTENLLQFAAQCPRLERIGLLSTVYVAGKRRGIIAEAELTHRAGFVNEYERSKYRMEQQARRFSATLPIAVYRLSTILGREDGEVVRWGAVHQALRLFFNGLIPMVPGERTSSVDLISLDFAVSALEELFLRRFEPGTTRQIAAGSAGSIALDEFLGVTASTFRAVDPQWSRRGIDVPPIVPLSTFRRLEEGVRTTGDVFLTRVLETMSRFAPQLAYPKTFEIHATLQPTPLRQWLPNVLRWCLASNWGRKAQTTRMAEAG